MKFLFLKSIAAKEPIPEKQSANWPHFFGWLIFIMFASRLLSYLAEAFADSGVQSAAVEALLWADRLGVGPLVASGIFYVIHAALAWSQPMSLALFVRGVRKHALSFIGLTFLLLLLSMVVNRVYFLTIGIGLGQVGSIPIPIPLSDVLRINMIAAPLGIIFLYTMAAIVVENGGVFLSIGRAVRTLFADRRPVVIGLFFILIALADILVAEWVKTLPDWLFILTTVRAILMAAFKVFIYVFTVRIYRRVGADRLGKTFADSEQVGLTDGREVSPVTCILLALLSFIPGVSLAAAWVGTRAFLNAPRFYLSGLICKVFGFFFIMVQVLAFIGFLLPKAPPIAAPSLDSVTNASPRLASALEMLRAGNVTGSQAELDRARQDLATPRWACDYLQGIIHLGTFKLGEAEAMLRRAQTQESERPEISYALGQAFYLQNKPEEAVDALNQALEKDPTLKGVARLRDLIQEIREPSPLFRGASFIVILLILFTIHEYAHAYSAFKFGDDTAKNAGRLTLNPIAHLDLLGSIILPALLLIRQSGLVFGWAKPVPVNCQNFKHPEKDYMVVSFAGPGANLLMAMACFICLQLIALSMRIISPESLSLQLAKPFAGVAITGIIGASYIAYVVFVIKQLMFTSLVLGFLNLIPVPPLDGSGVLAGILGPVGRQRLEKFRPYGFFVLLLFVLTPVFNIFLIIPVQLVWAALKLAMIAMGFD